jgi:hypothetical protein
MSIVLSLGILGGLIISVIYFLLQEQQSTFTISVEITKPQTQVFEYFKEFDFIHHHPYLKRVEFHQLIDDNIRDFRYNREVFYLFGVFKIIFPPGIIRFTKISDTEVNFLTKPRVFDIFDFVFLSKVKVIEIGSGTKVEETVNITGPRFLCYVGKQLAEKAHEEMMRKVLEIV